MITKEEFYESCTKGRLTVGWSALARDYERMFGEKIGPNSLRKRWYRRFDSQGNRINQPNTTTEPRSNEKDELVNGKMKEFTTRYEDGTIEASSIVQYSKEIFGDNDKLMRYLGYDPDKWVFQYVTTKTWQQSRKDGNGGYETQDLYSVNYRLKPKSELNSKEFKDAFMEAIRAEVRPIELPKKSYTYDLDVNKMMEIPPIELHLGKLANIEESKEDYDLKIAAERFYDIFEKVAEKQSIEKCGKCLLVIGSDFFNSESDGMTTGKTPQQNDTRYKKMFIEGTKMYISAIMAVRKIFNKVDVILCAGNHARAMEFFMYYGLQQRFINDDVVTFKTDYRDTQAYKFGNCAIFYNHGDNNLKQTISSIPAEFYDIWGKTIYRELHLGHLHKEVTVDDNSGMITRRIGSPCGTDTWHYQSRYIGATKKHQLFIWNKECGLECIYYVNNK